MSNDQSGNPEVSYATDSLEVTRVITGPLDNNVYFLRSTVTGEAAMIDAPGGNPDSLVQLSSELNVSTVFITHGHHDHIGAIAALRNSGVKVGIGLPDADMTPQTDFTIDDNQKFAVGDVEVTAISTPGHTPGSTCFLIEGAVFSGDTLFAGGPGATRWHYSSFDTIIDSISQKLFSLDDATVVFPGHGRSTTVGVERPALDAWITRRW